MPNDIKKPSQLLHLSEIFRAIYENILGIMYLWSTPKSDYGQGRVVVVVPGLLSADFYTTLLRKYLNKIGFKASGWGLGVNLGRTQSLNLLIDKIHKLSSLQNQKIILIGWSLGGIFAREVAKVIPNSIEKVITLGSPFGDLDAPNHARWVYDLLNDPKDVDHAFVANIATQAPVPTIALYSKLDGMVPWQACLEHLEDSTHKNVEIKSSHFGMGGNPLVLKAITQHI